MASGSEGSSGVAARRAAAAGSGGPPLRPRSRVLLFCQLSSVRDLRVRLRPSGCDPPWSAGRIYHHGAWGRRAVHQTSRGHRRIRRMADLPRHVRCSPSPVCTARPHARTARPAPARTARSTPACTSRLRPSARTAARVPPRRVPPPRTPIVGVHILTVRLPASRTHRSCPASSSCASGAGVGGVGVGGVGLFVVGVRGSRVSVGTRFGWVGLWQCLSGGRSTVCPAWSRVRSRLIILVGS